MSDIFNFGELNEFQPYEGDGAAVLLPFDGDVQVKVTKITKGESSSGNKTVKIVMQVAETDLPGGTLYKDIPYTGKRRDGKPNAFGFGEFLMSCGWTLEQIKGAASANQNIDMDKIIHQILSENSTSYVSVVAGTYNGRERSEVTNFITKERYDKQAASRRRPRQQQGVVGNGAGSTAVAAGGNDPLAKLM